MTATADDRFRQVVLLGAVLVIGFLIGTWRAGVKIETGRADTMGNGGGSISTDGWTYGFPPEVTWIDANDVWHDQGIPECLPPLVSVEGLRFAWTEVTVEGSTWRPVVWVDCRSVPQP